MNRPTIIYLVWNEPVFDVNKQVIEEGFYEQFNTLEDAITGSSLEAPVPVCMAKVDFKGYYKIETVCKKARAPKKVKAKKDE